MSQRRLTEKLARDGQRISGSSLRALLLPSLFLAFSLGTANAQFTPSNQVNFTLEGCRNDGTITLPINGLFICPDGGTASGGAYTTGNLGKGWNELDLVPHRLVTQSGGQSSATTSYNVIVAADYQTNGHLGYDVISVPTVHTTESDVSCQVTAGSQLTNGPTFGGGTDIAVYRILSIQQNKNTTCVFDYYQRLALGSHLYPGSSLQSYMFQDAGFSIGKKTISIPVNQILPQSLSKNMNALQGGSYPWTISKSATVNSLSFGNVCAVNPTTSLPVNFTVTWTKGTPDQSGNITVTTQVFATNPAARSITTSVTDVIYSGTTSLDTSGPTTTVVPANTSNVLVLSHTISVASGTTSLNDIATATYTDTVTSVPIPGTTMATASADVQSSGVNANSMTSITDVEAMTGLGLTFSLPSPLFGGFIQDPVTMTTYTADTKTQGPVDWNGQPSSSGSVTFNKTVYLDMARITSGVLTDSAVLTSPDSTLMLTAGPVNVNISSSASPTLTISKSIPANLYTSGQVVTYFTITRAGDPTYSTTATLAFAAGSMSASVSFSVPDADMYTVMETDAEYFPSTCTPSIPLPACATKAPLTPSGGNTQTVDLSKDSTSGVVKCTGTATITNSLPNTGNPRAQVRKSTLPNTDTSNWSFTLAGPGLPAGGITIQAAANATTPNNGYVDFGVGLTLPGVYTVTETTKSAWYLYSAMPNNGTATKVCTFTVVFPDDFNAGTTFNCDFVNSQQYAGIKKTVKGLAPTTNDPGFTFQLRQNATSTADGTILESGTATAANGGNISFATLLTPGQTYQVCEIVMPGWLTTLGQFVPNSFIPPSGVAPNPAVDNSILCGNFTVTAGQTLIFTVDNTPPPGGRALTIGFWKNWASCASSGNNKKPVLDQTLALFGANGEVVSATSGIFATFGPTYYLTLLGSTSSPNVAPDCLKAVRLLNKSTISSGSKMASDPAFNLAAQLVAAELNFAAGAGKTTAATTAINQAVLLLGKYSFNGNTHTAISAADVTLMNSLATTLDNYNNDRP